MNEENQTFDQNPLDQLTDGLVEKGELLLKVKVSTREEADELIRWMYSKDKSPMRASLLEIAWDKVAVPKQIADALQVMQDTWRGAST